MSADSLGLGAMFLPPDGAEAGWLVCRRLRREDTAALYEAILMSLDHLRPWMPWADGYTREMAEDFVARHTSASPSEPVTDAPYVVADRTGRLLGLCGLHGRLGAGRLEIGYWVDARHKKQGVATLSAAMLTERALELSGIDAVEIHHDEANRVSGHIPAKLGFEHVATVKDEPEAPAESGVEWQWRLDKDAWPVSPAKQLLDAARAAG